MPARPLKIFHFRNVGLREDTDIWQLLLCADTDCYGTALGYSVSAHNRNCHVPVSSHAHAFVSHKTYTVDDVVR